MRSVPELKDAASQDIPFRVFGEAASAATSISTVTTRFPTIIKKWLRGLYKASYAFRDRFDTDGVNHYKRMFDITDGLIRRGYSEADIELILCGNFRRVLGKI